MATTHRRAPAVVSEVVEGQAVIVNHDGGQMHTLNEAATLMWRLLDEPTSTDELVAAVAARHPDVDPDIVRADVGGFLRDGIAKGILASVTS